MTAENTVELTRFRVLPENTGRLLAARPAMLADFRADRAGFLTRRSSACPATSGSTS